MAKIIENEKAFKVIEIDYLEMLKIGCGNICDHQGDAIAFLEWDLPTFTDAQIQLFIKTFKIENKYKRLDKNKYAKVQIF